MKKLSIVVAASLLVALAGSTCFAAVNAGENEVSISGSYRSVKMEGSSDTTDTTFIRGGMGHYLSDNFSIGGDLMYINSSSGTASSDSTTLVANVNARFYLAPKSTVIPYIGAQLGYQGTDSGPYTLTGYNYGAMGGIKFFMSENASFDVELNYSKATVEASGAGSSGSSTSTTLAGLFGLTYYFGK
jgi:hypothetical protein